jgi:hypothetical protein
MYESTLFIVWGERATTPEAEPSKIGILDRRSRTERSG